MLPLTAVQITSPALLNSITIPLTHAQCLLNPTPGGVLVPPTLPNSDKLSKPLWEVFKVGEFAKVSEAISERTLQPPSSDFLAHI